MGKMKALVLKETMGLEGFEFMKVERPEPKTGEVLVELKAAALNHRDLWILQGLYANISTPVVLGSDGAGIVREVGRSVSSEWIGKKVLINPSLFWGNDAKAQSNIFRILGMPDNGTQAQFISIPASNIIEKPSYLSWEEAAAIPLAGVTGYRALFTQGKLKAGETVLLTGIGGGVAALMLQMALSVGSTVLVTSGSKEKINQAKQLGAAHGVNYKDRDWPEKLADISAGRQIDLIVDSAGGDGFTKLTSLIKSGGRIVFFGATVGNPSELNLRQLFWKQITLQGTTMGTSIDFLKMVQLFDSNKIYPQIDSTYLLEDYQKAYAQLMYSKQFGKVVFTI